MAYFTNMPVPPVGIHFTMLPSIEADRKVRTIQGNIKVTERSSPKHERHSEPAPEECVRLAYKDVKVSCAGEVPSLLYNAEGVNYQLPSVRFQASFELGPVKSDTNWHFGWISAIENQNFCLTYGDCGVVKIELPPIMVNLGDSTGLPWYSTRAAQHVCVPCPKEHDTIVQVVADQRLRGHHPWTVRPLRRLSGHSPFLSKIAYSGTVYTWLAAMEGITDCLYLFETYQRDMSYEYEILHDGKTRTFQQLCKPQVGAPIKLDGNIEIPESVLTSPDTRHATRHVFYPTGGGAPEILIPPALDLFGRPAADAQKSE